MKHTLSVVVEDESGALSRIAGLFAAVGSTLTVWLSDLQSRVVSRD